MGIRVGYDFFQHHTNQLLLGSYPTPTKISSKFAHNFLSYPVRRSGTQKNKGKDITSLV